MAPDPIISRGHRNLLLTAAVMTGLLVTLGSIVCVTESGAACPDWPTCYGGVVPPPQAGPIIEYTHRFVAMLTTPLILAAAFVGWRKSRSARWVSRPPLLAIPFLVAVITLGALVVLRGLPPILAAADLGSALVVLALMVTAAVAGQANYSGTPGPAAIRRRDAAPTAGLSLAALGAVFLLHVSGILVAGKGSVTRCMGWPMWSVLPGDLSGWPQIARLALSVVAAVLVLSVAIQAWRAPGSATALRRVGLAAGVAFVVEMAAGLLMLASGPGSLLLVVYAATAVALWSLLVALAALAGPVASTDPAQAVEQGSGRHRAGQAV